MNDSGLSFFDGTQPDGLVRFTRDGNLNSKARILIWDYDDSTSPTWDLSS